LDNPSSEPSQTLNTDTAAQAFNAILSAEEPPKSDPQANADSNQPAADPEIPLEMLEQPAEPEPEMVEVDVDGYKVSLPKEKADKLQAERLMQADYTKKTMAAAEERKAAEAEIQRASQERQQYAQNLQRMQVQLETALQSQQQIDWEQLIADNPQEALRQQHLMQVRQAQLQQNYVEQQRVTQAMQAEQAQRFSQYLSAQREELLAKLPEWKDETKAKAQKAELADYLMKQGYDPQAIGNVSDAKAVVLAVKAMKYDQMVQKAQVAAKKVATLPTKVEQPGTGANPGLDRRTSAFNRLSKSGKVEDAAAVFASFI
jgi:hypothetical protein